MLYVGNLGDETLRTIHIYNMLGAEVLNSNSYITNLNTLPAGVYVVRMETDRSTTVEKITVK